MRITIVGPGIIDIPPKGWGATEILINDHASKLREFGHKITIVNEKNCDLRNKAIKKSNPDIIHLHYEKYLDNLDVNPDIDIYLTSHYPYTDQYIKYANYFTNKKIYLLFSLFIKLIPKRLILFFRFNEVLLSLFIYYPIFKKIINFQHNKKLICLSDRILSTYKFYGCKNDLFLSHNFVNEKSIAYEKNNFEPYAICLGKIESRKNQSKLKNIPCLFFAGPIADKNFSENNFNYIGEWTREMLYKSLTKYSTLVLLSKGEAHALVICEALVAGLGLVISEEASSNLDKNKEFIDIISIKHLNNTSYIEKIIKKNIIKSSLLRDEIREYGLNKFSLKNFQFSYPPIVNKNR